MGRFASAPAFFGLRVASGLLLLKLAARFLSVGQFAAFSQLMLFAALLNLAAVAGAQNGLIRQAAATDDPDRLARTQSSAFLIWKVTAPALAILIAILSGRISDILVGTTRMWPIVIAIALLALAAGPGQIWCSLLSGRQRGAHSLAAQASGLVVGTALAGWAITRGDAPAAAIGFASGGLVTALAAFLLAARLRIPRVPMRSATPEVSALLRYSAATAATAGFSALVMFSLRVTYRNAFGATALGYWMAASRISDMSTQLLGLFMIQFFVPQIAMTAGEADRRRVVTRGWMIGAAAMGAILGVFSLAPRLLVHLLLSNAFLPAIPAIWTYMSGDFLRVWASLAIYAAFARGQPGLYAAIEMATTTVMAVIVLTLIQARWPQAPQLGYVGAYALIAAAITVAYFRRPRPAPA